MHGEDKLIKAMFTISFDFFCNIGGHVWRILLYLWCFMLVVYHLADLWTTTTRTIKNQDGFEPQLAIFGKHLTAVNFVWFNWMASCSCRSSVDQTKWELWWWSLLLTQRSSWLEIDDLHPQSLTACPWKLVVGRQAFPIGKVTFQGRTVKLWGCIKEG